MGVGISMGSGCTQAKSESAGKPVAAAAPRAEAVLASGAERGQAPLAASRQASVLVSAAAAAPASTAAPATAPAAAAAPVSAAASIAKAAPVADARAASSLSVKRFVVGSGVKDREPLVGGEPLVSDGSPIYAFAELANPHGGSENVRITFERRGGSERVGDVSLPVPGNVERHRTWAFTRFIRAPGVWEAVLWSESGVELSRTSFEVTGS
jgi:hypothetical protein